MLPTAEGLTADRRPCVATSVTFIAGDGIGPEVIEAAPRILDAGGAWPVWEEFASVTARDLFGAFANIRPTRELADVPSPYLGRENVERIAFEVARAEGRRSVVWATKAYASKLSEGLLKRPLAELSPEYPEMGGRHLVVDRCAHQLVRRPGHLLGRVGARLRWMHVEKLEEFEELDGVAAYTLTQEED